MTDRIKTIQSKLSNSEAALITSDPSRFYLTGFKSSAGFVFITKENATLLIDFRYYEKAKSVVKHIDTVLYEKVFEQIADIAKKNAITSIYVETDRISVDEFSIYQRAIGVDFSEDSLLTDTLRKMREVKTQFEIDSIKTAQSFTDKTFSYILERISAGRTETDIMLDMEFFMRNLGSEGVAFDFIVVSGKNSSLPHGVPTDKKIENGDFITMDFGAVYNGYMSDMTRTVAVGGISDKQREVYDTVLEAQNKAFELIKTGKKCVEIDKAARDYIYSRGYEGCFGHGLGHSVGIEIHENPSFNTRCETRLKSGMVLTVEPGIYIEDEFGVRIEDMVVINDSGFENLTASSKELIIL